MEGEDIFRTEFSFLYNANGHILQTVSKELATTAFI